ncbi:hypothetical protein Thiosp_00684 [Thiorhodovibrio litoralis]|nr:hypothetical protein Thiosp_00684 [Thiorhodovibrio litoralis]
MQFIIMPEASHTISAIAAQSRLQKTRQTDCSRLVPVISFTILHVALAAARPKQPSPSARPRTNIHALILG